MSIKNSFSLSLNSRLESNTEAEEEITAVDRDEASEHVLSASPVELSTSSSVPESQDQNLVMTVLHVPSSLAQIKSNSWLTTLNQID